MLKKYVNVLYFFLQASVYGKSYKTLNQNRSKTISTNETTQSHIKKIFYTHSHILRQVFRAILLFASYEPLTDRLSSVFPCSIGGKGPLGTRGVLNNDRNNTEKPEKCIVCLALVSPNRSWADGKNNVL